QAGAAPEPAQVTLADLADRANGHAAAQLVRRVQVAVTLVHGPPVGDLAAQVCDADAPGHQVGEVVDGQLEDVVGVVEDTRRGQPRARLHYVGPHDGIALGGELAHPFPGHQVAPHPVDVLVDRLGELPPGQRGGAH